VLVVMMVVIVMIVENHCGTGHFRSSDATVENGQLAQRRTVRIRRFTRSVNKTTSHSNVCLFVTFQGPLECDNTGMQCCPARC